MLFLFLFCFHEGHVPVAPLETATLEAQIQSLQARADANPNSLYAWNQLGEVLLQLGQVTAEHARFHQADVCFQKAQSLVPENKMAQYGRVRALMGVHRFSEALAMLRPLGQAPDADPIFNELYFDLHFSMGHATEAYALARSLVQDFPGFQGEIRLAQIEAYFGLNEKARNVYQKWAENPQLPVFQRAWCTTRLGDIWMDSDPQRADQMFDQALALDPSCHYAHLQIAKLDCASGHASEAVARLSQVVKSNSRPEYRYQLALALGQSGQAEKAKSFLNELETQLSAEIERDDWGHVRLLCSVWQTLGTHANQQVAYLEKEFQQIRSDREGILALARAYLNAGQSDQACAVFQAGAQDAGLPQSYLWTMAEALRRANRAVPARYLVQRLNQMPTGYLDPETQAFVSDLKAWAKTAPPIPTLVQNTPQTGH